jgi:hypothetical protein
MQKLKEYFAGALPMDARQLGWPKKLRWKKQKAAGIKSPAGFYLTHINKEGKITSKSNGSHQRARRPRSVPTFFAKQVLVGDLGALSDQLVLLRIAHGVERLSFDPLRAAQFGRVVSEGGEKLSAQSLEHSLPHCLI